MINNEPHSINNTGKEYVWIKWRIIWIIAFIAGLTFLARETETASETLVGLGQIHRVIGISLLAIILMKLFVNNPSVPFKSIFFFWTFFALWQMLTTSWSTFPAWTLYRSSEYIILVSITAYCANSLQEAKQLTKWINLIWFFIGILVLSVWLSVIISPGEALSPGRGIIPVSINGLFPKISSNSVSMYGAIIGIVSFVRMRYTQEMKWKVLLFLAIVTMILSQGRSGMASFALGIIIAILLMRRYGIMVILGSLIFLLISFYAFDEIFLEYFRRGQTEEQFWLFSGRINVWEYTYHYFIVDQPWKGFGAYSAGRFLVLGNYLGWSSLHSTWLELAVGNGIPATIFFAVIVIYSWIVIIKHCLANYGEAFNSYFIEISSVFTALIFRSLFTTHFMVHNDFVFFLIIGTVFYIKSNTHKVNHFN